MRHRSALLLLAVASLVGGCNLFLGDWEVGEGSGGGATTASTGVGGAPNASGAVGLERIDIESGGVAVVREGFFRIDAKPDSAWQWFRWFHLASDAAGETSFRPYDFTDTDFENAYYRTQCLWTAYHARDNGAGAAAGTFEHSCEGLSDENTVDVGAPTLKDATPVWFSIAAAVDNFGTAGTTFITRVYASGRVWTHAVVSTTVDLGEDTDIGFGQVSVTADQFQTTSASEEGLLRRVGGGPAVLSVNVGDLDASTTDWTEEAEWISGRQFSEQDAGGIFEARRAFASNEALTFIVPFHLGTDDDLAPTREERIADLRAPGLEHVDGATSIHEGTGYVDPETGAYDVHVEGAIVTLTLDGSHARFEPAFDVHGWASATWTITLDGDVIAKTGEPHPNALATKVDDTLSFQYLGAIDAGASEEGRTFTITE